MLLESIWKVLVSLPGLSKADHGLLLQVQKRSWRAPLLTRALGTDLQPGILVFPAARARPAPAQRRPARPRTAVPGRGPGAGGGRDAAGHGQLPQRSWDARVPHPREAEARGPGAWGSPTSSLRVRRRRARGRNFTKRPAAVSPAPVHRPAPETSAHSQTMRPTRAGGQSSLTPAPFTLGHVLSQRVPFPGPHPWGETQSAPLMEIRGFGLRTGAQSWKTQRTC